MKLSKVLPFINLGLAVVMLFFALPKLGVAEAPLGNAFWITWIAFSAIVIAANGNVILMSEEKKERLRAIKRQKALRLERKLVAFTERKKEKEKEKIKGTA